MNNEELTKTFAETSQLFQEAVDRMELEQENYWDGLTDRERLMAFCAVVRRIYKGDVEDRGTYRYVLYDVFDFGPESYLAAQVAGYLSIHNLIFEALEADEQIKTNEQQT